MLPRLIFLLSAPVLLPTLLPGGAPSSPHEVLLSRGRTEPVIASSPSHRSTVVVGSNTNYDVSVGGTFPTAFFTSWSAGRSFHSGTVPVRPPYTTGADPSVAVSRSGAMYYTYLGETPSYCSGGRSAVMLATSLDGGQGFGTPAIVDADPADDKPNMALEDVAGRTHLFVTWTRWHDSQNRSDIWYSRSADGGRTFSRPVMLYSSGLDNFGSVPVVGPRGRLYVFWAVFPEGSMSSPTRTELFMRSSADDGRSFGPRRSIVGSFWSVPRMAQPGSLRNLTMPAVVVGKDGTLYLAYAAARQQRGNGQVDADIMITRSRNHGLSWSRAHPVNDRSYGDRFMPALALLSDGSPGVAFYDRRNDPWQLDLYAARVTFGRLAPLPNIRVNTMTAPVADIYYIAPGSTCFSPGRFFGDYIGAATGPNGSLYVVWADTQLHVYDETEIWFATVTLPGLR